MKKSLRSLFCGLIAASLLGVSAPALAAEEATTGHAVYWEGTIMVEGHEAYFAQNGQSYQPINYKGNVYVPLFALGEWTASTARWDSQAKKISVHYNAVQPIFYRTASEMPSEDFNQWQQKVTEGRNTGFEVTVLTDTTVTGDYGDVITVTPDGVVLYPIVYENIPYLSVRAAAQLSDKTLCYFHELSKRPRPSIYLYQKPSQEQIQAAQDYLDEVDARIQALDTYLATLPQAATTQELHDRLVALKALLLRIKDPSIPSIPTLTEAVQRDLFYYGVDGDDGLRALAPDITWSADPASASTELWRVRELHATNLHALAETLTGITLRMRQIVNGMAAGELRG